MTLSKCKQLARRLVNALQRQTAHEDAVAAECMQQMHAVLECVCCGSASDTKAAQVCQDRLASCILLCHLRTSNSASADLLIALSVLFAKVCSLHTPAATTGNRDMHYAATSFAKLSTWETSMPALPASSTSNAVAGAARASADTSYAAAVALLQSVIATTEDTTLPQLRAALAQLCAHLAVCYFHIVQRHTLQQLPPCPRMQRANELGIHTAPVSSDGDVLLAAIVAADGDAGQMALRDLVVSFLLPRTVIGRRTTLLMSREQHGRAQNEFAKIVSYAHRVAMRGASCVWRQEMHTAETVAAAATGLQQDEQLLEVTEMASLEKTCALLAGLGMLLTPKAADSRAMTALDGVLQLPFLHVSEHSRASVRLFLLEDEWYLTQAQVDAQETRLLCRGVGLDGLCECARTLMSALHM